MIAPMIKPSNPNHGMVVYNKLTDKLQAYDGYKLEWVYIDEAAPMTYCSVCKVEFFEHQTTEHPFCKTNLDYLEWQYEHRD